MYFFGLILSCARLYNLMTCWGCTETEGRYIVYLPSLYVVTVFYLWRHQKIMSNPWYCNYYTRVPLGRGWITRTMDCYKIQVQLLLCQKNPNFGHFLKRANNSYHSQVFFCEIIFIIFFLTRLFWGVDETINIYRKKSRRGSDLSGFGRLAVFGRGQHTFILFYKEWKQYSTWV